MVCLVGKEYPDFLLLAHAQQIGRILYYEGGGNTLG